MQKESESVAKLVRVSVTFCISIFVSVNVYALDYGEWKAIERDFAWRRQAERWSVFKESSESYRIKSGINIGTKLNGNIIVVEIANRIMPYDKRKIVLRSSMFPLV